MSDFREFQQQYNDYLMHSGRKGMKWGKSIFQDDYDPIGEVAGSLSNAYNYVRQLGGRAKDAAEDLYDRARSATRNLSTSHDVYRTNSQPNNNTQRLNNHLTATHDVYRSNSRQNRSTGQNNGNDRGVIDSLREGASNAYNSARKQAFMARANASVAADKARTAINNIPNEARQAFHRVGIEADRLTSRGLRKAADIFEKYDLGSVIPKGVGLVTTNPTSSWKTTSQPGGKFYIYTPRDERWNQDAERMRNQAANRDLQRIADTLNPFSGNKQQNTSSRQNGSMNGIDLDKLRLDAANTIDRGKEEVGARVLRGLGRALNVDSKEEEERYRRSHINNRRRNTANYVRNH